jgi:hypothetical protein
MSNYSQYLGAKRCCDLKVQGPQGYQGAQGPSAIGGMGPQGATGVQGYQGATGRGCRGTTGAQGPPGVTGPAGGPQGLQGATGATGAQGFQGTTGPSQWTPMNGVGQTGGGYTGIGITGQDVLIYGNLLVTGGIDPTYLALTPQPSGPQGFINPLWIDNSGNLRSENILLDDGSGNTLTLSIDPSGNSVITATDNISLSADLDVSITSQNGDINLNGDTTGSGFINMNAFGGVVINKVSGYTPPDYSKTTMDGYAIETFEDLTSTTGVINQMIVNPVELFIDNTDNTNQTQQYGRYAPNAIEVYDHTNSGTNSSRIQVSSETFNYTVGGIVKPSFYQFQLASNNIFRYDLTGIKMGTSGTGVAINNNNIKYPATYNTAQATLTNTSNSVQTFNISNAPFGAILPNATATNVGTQFIITNTNASENLGVTTVGGSQLIYSSTGAPSSVSRVLQPGYSQIFTAIQTTGPNTYGWSMV